MLFPNAQISNVSNPLPGRELIRIPPKGQVFTLDDQDLGEETVYLAVSLRPLDNLADALASVHNGQPGSSERLEQAMTSLFDEAAPECANATRGLTVSEESGCGSMSRGLTPSRSSDDDFFSDSGSSVQVQSLPGDDVVLKTFRFRHVE